MQQLWERSEKMGETALLIPRWGEGGASLQPVVKTMLKQIFPCSPWRCIGKQGSTLQPVPVPELGGCTLKGAVAYIESMPQLLSGAVTCGESTLKQFLKDCTLQKGYMLQQFLKNCICGRDPTLEQGRRMWRKKQQRRNVIKWPHLLFPFLLPCLWGGGDRRVGNELGPGKEDLLGGGVLFLLLFITVLFSY